MRRRLRDARQAADGLGELLDEQLLADVAAKLRLGHIVLAQEAFEPGLIETARHAGEDRQVGDAAVDEPLADPEAEFVRILLKRFALDELVQHLVEPARFDEGGNNRKSVVSGKSVSGRVGHGGRRYIQKKNKK